jgi:hypothetical protein
MSRDFWRTNSDCSNEAHNSTQIPLRIVHQSPMVYRLRCETNVHFGRLPPTCNAVLPIPDEIVDGSFNTVSAVFFDLAREGRGSTHWVALVEARNAGRFFT